MRFLILIILVCLNRFDRDFIEIDSYFEDKNEKNQGNDSWWALGFHFYSMRIVYLESDNRFEQRMKDQNQPKEEREGNFKELFW